MPDNSQDDARRELLETLLEKIRTDTYPSNTMLDMAEELLTPSERPAYMSLLQERIRGDQFPSIPMLQRLQAML